MKKEILWMALLVVAVLVKIFNVPSNYAIGWPLSPDTRLAIPMSTVIFWVLLGVLAIWVLIDLAHRWRAGILR